MEMYSLLHVCTDKNVVGAVVASSTNMAEAEHVNSRVVLQIRRLSTLQDLQERREAKRVRCRLQNESGCCSVTGCDC